MLELRPNDAPGGPWGSREEACRSRWPSHQPLPNVPPRTPPTLGKCLKVSTFLQGLEQRGQGAAPFPFLGRTRWAGCQPQSGAGPSTPGAGPSTPGHCCSVTTSLACAGHLFTHTPSGPVGGDSISAQPSLAPLCLHLAGEDNGEPLPVLSPPRAESKKASFATAGKI